MSTWGEGGFKVKKLENIDDNCGLEEKIILIEWDFSKNFVSLEKYVILL